MEEPMARPWNELGRYGGVGIELVLAVLILGGVGHWLDQRYWGGHDWGMTAVFLLGIAVGVRNLVRVAQRMQRDIERAEARDPEGSRWTVDPSWLHEQNEGEEVAREPESNHTGRAKKGRDDAPN
jgi:hypothetical protein